MNYFALQVKTRAETKFIHLAMKTAIASGDESMRLVFPRKMLPIRRLGKIRHEIVPVFPGYIFVETPFDSSSFYWEFRSIPGFFRYLPDNQHPLPLDGHDLVILKHFISFGPVAKSSVIQFDENDRIHVQCGPLKGLEGSIVKVDKRKCRARVKLDMYSNS